MLQLFFTLVNDLCNKHTRNVKGFYVHNRIWKGYTLFSQWNYDLYGIMNTLTTYLLIYLRTIAICPLNINFKWENKLVMAQTVSK